MASCIDGKHNMKALPVSREPQKPAVRHISIAGISYCGSTVFGALLGGLPGVCNIGESYWLTRCKSPGAPEILDFAAGPEAGVLQCVNCGLECDYITPDFRRNLQKDPSRWYQKIGAQMGTEVVVSSEKNYKKIVACDPEFDCDAIIVFKSPAQAWWSNVKKFNDSRFNSERHLQSYLKKWGSVYKFFLEDFYVTGNKSFLYFDDFCARPRPYLQALALQLDLPPPPPEICGRHSKRALPRGECWFP